MKIMTREWATIDARREPMMSWFAKVLAPLLFCVAAPCVLAAETAPLRLAVFDFELEDGSAGASIAGNSAADEEHMRSVSTEVRRAIEKSGRYELIDVGNSDEPAVKTHSLRKCNGCDAVIARNAGAEQSLIGVVRRITRTEFVVSFKLTDAKTGAVLAFHESDLQMGADYSWSRGAVRLIRERLLDVKR
jgi:hypothetical protein